METLDENSHRLKLAPTKAAPMSLVAQLRNRLWHYFRPEAFPEAFSEYCERLSPQEKQGMFALQEVILRPYKTTEYDPNFKSYNTELKCFLAGVCIGSVRINVCLQKGVVQWITFYPMQKLRHETQLARTGIGTIAQVKVLEWMREHLPNASWHIEHSPNLSISRRKHLGKILNMPHLIETRDQVKMPLEEYFAASLDFARQRGFFVEDQHSKQ